ncbi:MAG: S8 family serine peptidase [Deltaproteobacteria bacterium]|nr:S8 family serine peptidase [Deltaproteobacteria bacterium]
MRNGFFLTVRRVLFAATMGALIGFGASGAHAAEYKSGEIVVKIKEPSRFSGAGLQAHALLSDLSQDYDVTVTPFQTDENLVSVKAEGKVAIEALLAAAAKSGAVEYAEPNWIYRAFGSASDDQVVPNDANFKLDWGLYNFGQRDSKGQEGTVGSDIGTTKAWKLGTGSKDIVVAVIDTGVDYTHEELKDNIFANTKEVAGNGKDDDGNGFVDDVRGWNFQGKNNDPMDDNRHGTHVSGTIGAKGNNAIGTAGVNWDVRIVPLKFLSSQGSGTLTDAVEAIKYATKLKVNVMSNSWGGGGYSQTMFDAIKDAQAKGILFVAAAGNEKNDNDARASYPASYRLDNVISVAASDNRDVMASFSNYGAKSVHLSAPGVNVYSTVPAANGGYATFSGTSMACPHVAGASALLWSLNKGWTYKQVKERLLATVDPVRGLKSKTVSGGRLNVYNAIMNITPVPNEPTGWKAVSKTVESKHPYENGVTEQFELVHHGAKFVRVHFSKVDTEKSYDVITVKDANGKVVEEISGNLEDYTSEYVEGGNLTVSFTADTSVNGYGFVIDKYEFTD